MPQSVYMIGNDVLSDGGPAPEVGVNLGGRGRFHRYCRKHGAARMACREMVIDADAVPVCRQHPGHTSGRTDCPTDHGGTQSIR
jgi:hypothetical protein